ncbi:hypothetical protein EMIHUDRAFT_214930 [Emiliania huxleyi CCMP1516]|uniref:Lactate/malate dehydrogenase N-terminal domain-containing protein n=2 Tax=Emiliania huxleyi TaxID=2903 RepID=A0A0D3IIM6_EMIH1|nr:hypothetical protein EMIHUDRAFT_214930 [Emiliania huxleyi CCMP1516]EOD11111.1 hypothetical protein EMIHUDRAFT_214930 [Emiliania huxleyi CCMP1516]|eukprot:XP_005763540.1 hypothetical protein EMIHUDRAFT_214930 [Emiliania huxleyi CCMP1516]
MRAPTQVRVALAGLGAIGLPVAEVLLANGIPGLSLAALHELADVVVEVLPPDQFMAVAEPTLGAGKTLVALSVTQLLAQPQLQDLARDRGGRLIVPTGALCGLDALRAVAEGGNVRSLAYT